MLCPLLMHLYNFPESSGTSALSYRLPPIPTYISAEVQKRVAIVCHPIRPFVPGQVEYQGRYWTAKCCHNVELKKDSLVNVIGHDLDEIALIVEPFIPPQNILYFPHNDWN